VQREKLVVGLVREQPGRGPHQLEPDEQAEDAAHQEEEERGEHVHHAYPLVVERGYPGFQAPVLEVSPVCPGRFHQDLT
jgi:hypothetical protein